jgi:hypothetical protein
MQKDGQGFGTVGWVNPQSVMGGEWSLQVSLSIHIQREAM